MNSQYHGHDGLLQVEEFSYYSLITQSFLKAAEELGFLVRDINGENQVGFTKSHGTLKDGFRCSTAKAFLRPVRKRKNLHITLYSQADEIIINDTIHGRVATGVNFRKFGVKVTTYATKEIILSAGAISSPQVKLQYFRITLFSVLTES